jgi:Repeat of unknown function (DUF5648)
MQTRNFSVHSTLVRSSCSSLFAFTALCATLCFAPIAAAQDVEVVEYYHRGLDAYFITSRANEKAALDAQPGDFTATGMRFAAVAPSNTPSFFKNVCRFYIATSNPFASSHFYGQDTGECANLLALGLPGFTAEGFDFAAAVPDGSGEVCSILTPVPIYRSFRPAANSRTPNHRYSAGRTQYEAMTAAGWTPEGIAFCVTSASGVVTANGAAFKRVITPAQSPYVAGCDGVTPELGVVNVGSEVEPHITRNPSNPDHLLASWQQDRWSNGGARGLGVNASFDGGRSWNPVVLPFSRCSGGNATNGGDYARATDPWGAIASSGTAYQMALAFTDAQNPVNSVSAMLVARSPDGGRSWDAPLTLVRDVSDDIFHDKNMIVADPVRPNNAYAVWGRILKNGTGPAWFSRTTDGGTTWETSRGIYDPGTRNQTFGNFLSILSDGTLVNVFLEILRDANGTTTGAKMRLIRSSDEGVTWSAPTDIAEYLGVGVLNSETGIAVRDGAGLPSVSAGVNNSLHVVWQDARFSGGAYDGVAYVRSADGGRTWSAPRQVNAQRDVPAFTPIVNARTDGVVGIAYFDLRANTSNTSTLPTVLRLTTSSDQNVWYESEIESAFDLNLAPIARGYFLGDYFGLTSRSGAFEAFYTRTTGERTVNRTEGVFASVPEGTLKSAAQNMLSIAPPTDAVVTPQFRIRVNANIERMLEARKRRPD